MTDLREALTALAEEWERRCAYGQGGTRTFLDVTREHAAALRALLAADERAETPRCEKCRRGVFASDFAPGEPLVCIECAPASPETKP